MHFHCRSSLELTCTTRGFEEYWEKTTLVVKRVKNKGWGINSACGYIIICGHSYVVEPQCPIHQQHFSIRWNRRMRSYRCLFAIAENFVTRFFDYWKLVSGRPHTRNS